LLLCCGSFALAEGPIGDPVPPAVIGRPLPPPVRDKPAAAKPAQPKTAARPASSNAAVHKPAPQPVVQDAAPAQRPAKQALDDRADPRMHMDNVGKGTHFARKPLGAGAYFGDRHRAAVLKYFHDHPASGTAAHWQIGEPLPNGAPVS